MSQDIDADQFNLGQLFVYKYGLHLDYGSLDQNELGQRIYSAQVSVMSEENVFHDDGLEVLAFIGIVMFMVICAYANYKLKINRIQREESFMY